ncbi:MAG: hypothetical protein SFV17_03780 [Candidatus Obscuribacter sp.]|nr:hypothetical protein [Candidatus Obscuribacter sp.]
MKKCFPQANRKLFPELLAQAGLALMLSASTAMAAPHKAAPAQAGAGSAAADRAADKAADGFNLYQTSTILGDQNIFVSAQGIKIFDRKSITGLTASAPDWQVCLYNNNTKRYCLLPFKSYGGLGKGASLTTGGFNLNKLPLKQSKKTETRGLAAIELTTTSDFEKKQQKDFERESADPRFPQSAELLVADKMPVPAQAATILCRYYGVPEGKGLPLQFKFVSLRGELHYMLMTNSLQAMKTSRKGFEKPQDYKLVPDPGKLEDKQKELPPMKFKETVRKIK